MDFLYYIYSHIANRKHCLRTNNTISASNSILSGVPQASVVGPILFNANFNYFFDFIGKASVYNFVDDNSLNLFAESVKDLLKFLELESKAAIHWFSINNMIVNPDKFQAMILNKTKRYYSNETLGFNPNKAGLFQGSFDCLSSQPFISNINITLNNC